MFEERHVSNGRLDTFDTETILDTHRQTVQGTKDFPFCLAIVVEVFRSFQGAGEERFRQTGRLTFVNSRARAYAMITQIH